MSADGGCTGFDGGDNQSTCTTQNKYSGASLQPGGSTSKSVRLIDVGSLTGSAFTLTPGSCIVDVNPSGTSGDICTQLVVALTCTLSVGGVQQGSSVSVILVASLATISGTVQDLKTAKNWMPPPGTWGGTTCTRFDFTISLMTDAGTGVQGQTAEQSLRWQTTAGS